MKKKRRNKPENQTAIAKERITELFKQADKIFKEDPKLSNRYVKLAWKIITKYKVKISSSLKKKFCRKCFSFLKVGKNCRVRLQNKKLVYYCKNCKTYMRIPYKKPKKSP